MRVPRRGSRKQWTSVPSSIVRALTLTVGAAERGSICQQDANIEAALAAVVQGYGVAERVDEDRHPVALLHRAAFPALVQKDVRSRHFHGPESIGGVFALGDAVDLDRSMWVDPAELGDFPLNL